MTLTPLHVANHILAGIEIETIRYFAGAAGVALVCWLFARAITHRRIQTRHATNADRWREMRQSLWAIAVFAVVDVFAVLMIMLGAIRVHQGPAELLTVIWQVVALTLMHDAYFYWMHRTLHHRRLFRMMHATHHVSRTPTSWAAYSFATGEAVFEGVIVPLMLVVLSLIAPVEPWAAFIFLGHQIARNAIGHSGFELAWPGFTRSGWTGWLTTTVHHDLHHSEGRYNFGLYFTWWDRWMGTEHPHYHERFEAVVNRRREAAAQEVPVHGSVSP